MNSVFCVFLRPDLTEITCADFLICSARTVIFHAASTES